jgi:hypothetical protein
VKEQRPAVKRMKNGNSFFGYTLTSWKTVAEKKSYSERSKRNGSIIILRKPLLAYLILSKEPEII